MLVRVESTLQREITQAFERAKFPDPDVRLDTKTEEFVLTLFGYQIRVTSDASGETLAELNKALVEKAMSVAAGIVANKAYEMLADEDGFSRSLSHDLWNNWPILSVFTIKDHSKRRIASFQRDELVGSLSITFYRDGSETLRVRPDPMTPTSVARIMRAAARAAR